MIGCLIIHGFSGQPNEVETIEAHLKNRNWLVYTPALPGHDGTKDGMKSFSHEFWVYKAQVALEELLERCEEVYVIGFSMGGMIASYLATKYKINKLILIGPAAYYLDPKKIAYQLKGWIQEGLRGDLEQNEYYNFYLDKLKNTPVSATLEFTRMVRRLRPFLKNIDVPTLIIQGEDDALVPIKSAEYIYDHIQSEEKHLFFIPKAKHYIWYGDQKQTLLDGIDTFFDNENLEKWNELYKDIYELEDK